MPGWTTGDNWHNNIAYTPGRVDRAAPHLREARRRRPVPHPLRPVARDPDGPGHALDLPVPEGRGLRLPDRRLPRQRPGHRREGRRRRGATAARRWSAATGWAGKPSATRGRSAERVEEAGRAVRARAAGHRAARSAGLPAEPDAWTGSITSSPRASCCRSTSPTPTWWSSTSIRPARIQDRERLKPILQGSLAFVRHIDEAAGCMYALQHEVLAAQGIPVQGTGRAGLSFVGRGLQPRRW